MELRHLQYFVTVAAELHFGRAAARLFISQPALSQRIRSLEGELGLRLLERTRHGVRLTPEGAVFLPEALAIVRQVDRATDVARALAEGARGQLRLSYLRTTAGGLPERLVSAYQRRFPRVELTADSGTTAANAVRLRTGDLDVAFVHTPLEHADDLGCVDVTSEALVVALPSTHPLSRRRRLAREVLAGLPLVYFPRTNTPGFYDRSLALVYGSASAAPIMRTEPSEERMLVAVAEGAGITLLVEDRAATLRYPGVTYRRFTDPEPMLALGVAFHQPLSLAAQRFVDLAQELAQQPTLAKRPRLYPPAVISPANHRATTWSWTGHRLALFTGYSAAMTPVPPRLGRSARMSRGKLYVYE
jgi:DNA-binding transcriptional LysR family regulator